MICLAPKISSRRASSLLIRVRNGWDFEWHPICMPASRAKEDRLLEGLLEISDRYTPDTRVMVRFLRKRDRLHR